MSILTVASGQSVYRGYEYYKANKVQRMEQIGEGKISASVSGSGGSVYNVQINVDHVRKSQCTCPHAAGKRIVCKHMVAVYFTAFPAEAQKYIAELEEYWEEEEQREQETEERLIAYVRKMKKGEAQEALLQLLFDGPEWQYDRFVEEYLGEW